MNITDLKTSVLRWRANVSCAVCDEMVRVLNGRLFQEDGPMYQKARCDRIVERGRGTNWSPRGRGTQRLSIRVTGNS